MLQQSEELQTFESESKTKPLQLIALGVSFFSKTSPVTAEHLYLCHLKKDGRNDIV